MSPRVVLYTKALTGGLFTAHELQAPSPQQLPGCTSRQPDLTQLYSVLPFILSFAASPCHPKAEQGDEGSQ